MVYLYVKEHNMSAQTVYSRLGYFPSFFQGKSFQAFEIVSEIIILL